MVYILERYFVNNFSNIAFQDFVWGFALLINGIMLQYMVIYYGTAKFRKELYNEYSTDDWTLPKVWEWMVK